jgi:hypothetical protein
MVGNKKMGADTFRPLPFGGQVGAERTYSLNFAASAWTSASVLQYSPSPR